MLSSIFYWYIAQKTNLLDITAAGGCITCRTAVGNIHSFSFLNAPVFQADTVTAAKLKCAAGLAALATRKYKQAAKSFVNVSPDLASSYSEVRGGWLGIDGNLMKVRNQGLGSKC